MASAPPASGRASAPTARAPAGHFPKCRTGAGRAPWQTAPAARRCRPAHRRSARRAAGSGSAGDAPCQPGQNADDQRIDEDLAARNPRPTPAADARLRGRCGRTARTATIEAIIMVGRCTETSSDRTSTPSCPNMPRMKGTPSSTDVGEGRRHAADDAGARCRGRRACVVTRMPGGPCDDDRREIGAPTAARARRRGNRRFTIVRNSSSGIATPTANSAIPSPVCRS